MTSIPPSQQRPQLDTLLTPEALATRWMITPRQLSQWRWKGRGPSFVKIGKKVLYPSQGITAFEQNNLIQGIPSHDIHRERIVRGDAL